MEKHSIKEIIENIEMRYTKRQLKEIEEIGDLKDILYSYISYIKNVGKDNLKLEALNNGLDLSNKEHMELLELFDITIVNKTPPQYILKQVNIYNEKYFVNESVLIPRSDTETLIESVIDIVNKKGLKSMLELCTGSGIIGVSVAIGSMIKEVLMTDISNSALEVARINIRENGAYNKCRTMCSNMFDEIPNKTFDIIVANPPYIETGEINNLSEYVKKEPSLALDGGEDGLKYYNIIYDKARDYLNDNGYIAVEIGYSQAKKVKNIILEYKEYEEIQIIKDLNNKDRVVICRFHKA